MDNSPLGRIPVELSITIYEYALTFDRLSCHLRPSDQSQRSLSTQLALIQVCRQIRAESRHMPLTLNNPIAGHIPCLCAEDRYKWEGTATTLPRTGQSTSFNLEVVVDKDLGVYVRKQKDCLVARFDGAQVLAVMHRH
jgi:hypothetical protein